MRTVSVPSVFGRMSNLKGLRKPSAQIARLPVQRAGMVVIALDHTQARTQRLADSLIDELVAR